MFDSETEAFFSLPPVFADEHGRRLGHVVRIPFVVELVLLTVTADEPRALDQAWTSRPGMLAAAALAIASSSQPVFSVPWLR